MGSHLGVGSNVDLFLDRARNETPSAGEGQPQVAVLKRRFGIPNHVDFRVGPGGLLTVKLTSSGGGSAALTLNGGQILSFKPRGQDDLLFQSSRTTYASGKPVRGGIPLCWPWFGHEPSQADLPKHGFARNSLFEVLETGVDRGAPFIRMGLKSSEKTQKLWPHDFALEVTVRVKDDALEVKAETVNKGRQPMPVTEALHAYFSVGDVRQVTVRGLEGANFFDKTSQKNGQQGLRPVRLEGDREFDRVFRVRSALPVRIVDPVKHRVIRVDRTGSEAVVVWNPGSEKAQGLVDLGPDYARMVCVEPANALSALRIPPGGRHSIALRIGVETGSSADATTASPFPSKAGALSGRA